MAVRTTQEILNAVAERLGEDTSDEVLTFIEDITDTLNDRDTQISSSGDWKNKYEENDKSWRERYRNRFFNSDDSNDDDMVENEEDDEDKPYTFENLFKED
jgi:hypothetical protein